MMPVGPSSLRILIVWRRLTVLIGTTAMYKKNVGERGHVAPRPHPVVVNKRKLEGVAPKSEVFS